MTYSNPIHQADCSDAIEWSRVNTGEALPGVLSPLTWTFFGDQLDRAAKGAFYDMGIMKRTQVVASPVSGDRLNDIFYGRAVANITIFRWIGDRTPGTSSEAIEDQLFGQEAEAKPASTRDRSRYPFIAVKLPWNGWRLVGQLNTSSADTKTWWQRNVRRGALDANQARSALAEAASRFEAVMRPHTVSAMLCQGLYDQLVQLAAKASRPGLELSLVTGYGDMAETDVVADLWAVSRDRLTLDEFVLRHGMHGPREGEMSSRVWRERRDPLEAMVHSYRGMPDDRDPVLVVEERRLRRIEAERELLAALPRNERLSARIPLKLAARYMPLRGVGKAAFLRCVDVGRAAARVIGADLAGRDLLADADDVFMLTLAELVAPVTPMHVKELTLERRAIHDEYLKVDVPDFFNGVPEPFPLVEPSADRSEEEVVVTGTAVSPGVVEGVARLVLDPDEDEALEPGEILVCRTTDPSWASMMMLASALVIDIGSPISHGAIVARELGIPCVIGTNDGTAHIRTGDRIRVDGQKGEARVLEQAHAV
jgi:phosphohistidine swiveling domain-containing protein